MESALYGIYTLIVFVSENSFINTLLAQLPLSNLYFWALLLSLLIYDTGSCSTQSSSIKLSSFIVGLALT